MFQRSVIFKRNLQPVHISQEYFIITHVLQSAYVSRTPSYSFMQHDCMASVTRTYTDTGDKSRMEIHAAKLTQDFMQMVNFTLMNLSLWVSHCIDSEKQQLHVNNSIWRLALLKLLLLIFIHQYDSFLGYQYDSFLNWV